MFFPQSIHKLSIPSTLVNAYRNLNSNLFEINTTPLSAKFILFVSFGMLLISCYIDTSISSSLSHVRRDDVSPPIHAISALRNDRVIATLKTTYWNIFGGHYLQPVFRVT